jgi:hypothetical protein
MHFPCAGKALLVSDFKVVEVTTQNNVVQCKVGLSYSALEESSFGGGLGSLYVDYC